MNKAVQELIPLVHDAQASNRCHAVEQLAQIATDEAIQVLENVLRRDPNEQVRTVAAEKLSDMSIEEALRLVSAHINAAPSIAKYAVRAIGKLRDSYAVTPLTTLMLDRENKSGHMKDVRKYAAWALGEIGDPKAVPALIEMITERSSYQYSLVLYPVIKALGKLKDRRAVKPLMEMLKEKPRNQENAVAICEVLGSLKDQRALPVLHRLAVKGNESERPAVIAAIGDIGAPWSREVICEVIGDKSEAVRKQAALALGKTGMGEDVPRLFKLIINDQNTDVQRAAYAAIVYIGEGGIDFLVNEYLESQDYVNGEYLNSEFRIPLLQRIGEASVKPLLRIAQDAAAVKTKRFMAIRAIGELGFPSSVADLRELITREFEDKEFTDHIASAIKAIVQNNLHQLTSGSFLGSPVDDKIVAAITENILKYT